MGIKDRRERERAARLNGILDAAAETFRDHGFESASVNEIARRAKLNIATLYYYYPSKDILYLGVLERAIQIIAPEMEAAAASSTVPRERLFRVFKAYVRFLTTYPEAQAVMHCLQSDLQTSDKPETAAMIGRAYQGTRRCIGIVTRIIADGTEGGAWTVDDPRETCAVLWASLNGVVQLAMNKGVFREPLEDDLLHRFVDLAVGGMRGDDPADLEIQV